MTDIKLVIIDIMEEHIDAAEIVGGDVNFLTKKALSVITSYSIHYTKLYEVTDKIRRDCVYMAHGFGVMSRGLTTVYGKGASDAVLLEDPYCPISGNVAMHETFVDIVPA